MTFTTVQEDVHSFGEGMRHHQASGLTLLQHNGWEGMALRGHTAGCVAEEMYGGVLQSPLTPPLISFFFFFFLMGIYGFWLQSVGMSSF